jgi:hypothetical protein
VEIFPIFPSLERLLLDAEPINWLHDVFKTAPEVVYVRELSGKSETEKIIESF